MHIWEEQGYQTKDIPAKERDPYQYPESSESAILYYNLLSNISFIDLTLTAVEAQLAALEEPAAANDRMQEITPTRWLALGISLEHDQ
jgi:hypothetical protein